MTPFPVTGNICMVKKLPLPLKFLLA
jgi:hypothetical protein